MARPAPYFARNCNTRPAKSSTTGISSGNSTVGNFGSDDRLEYTIIGKEVNAAARLEKNAEPGRILISEFTYEWVKDAIKCEPRGPLDLKGIERDIMTYWAVGTDGST